MHLIANYINIEYVTKSDSVLSSVLLFCIALLTMQVLKILSWKGNKEVCVCVCTTLILWRIDVTESNESYLDLHIKGPTFLFENSLTWILLTGFNKIVQNQISQNCPSRSWADTRGRTDGQTEGRTERPDEANRNFPWPKDPRLKINCLLKQSLVYARSQNCERRLLAPPCLSVRLSVRSME
jgi:hypothetical protein